MHIYIYSNKRFISEGEFSTNLFDDGYYDGYYSRKLIDTFKENYGVDISEYKLNEVIFNASNFKQPNVCVFLKEGDLEKIREYKLNLIFPV